MTKRGFVFGLFDVGANHLGFKDDATFSRPRFCCVVRFAVDVFSLSGHSGDYAGILHGLFRLALQHRVFSHRNNVLKVGFGIQKVEQAGMSEAAIEANADARAGK